MLSSEVRRSPSAARRSWSGIPFARSANLDSGFRRDQPVIIRALAILELDHAMIEVNLNRLMLQAHICPVARERLAQCLDSSLSRIEEPRVVTELRMIPPGRQIAKYLS